MRGVRDRLKLKKAPVVKPIEQPEAEKPIEKKEEVVEDKEKNSPEAVENVEMTKEEDKPQLSEKAESAPHEESK